MEQLVIVFGAGAGIVFVLALVFLYIGYWMGRNSAGLPTMALHKPGPAQPEKPEVLHRLMAGETVDDDEVPWS